MMNIQLYTTDLISGLEVGFLMEKINQHFLDFKNSKKCWLIFSMMNPTSRLKRQK